MEKGQSQYVEVGLFAKKLFWRCDMVDVHETKMRSWI